MLRRTKLILTVLSVLLFVQLSSGQNAPPPAAGLTVGGDVAKPLKLTAADIAKMPHKSLQAKGHDGKMYTYDGVPLIDILSQAGVQFGESLRGPKMQMFLLVEAADGYRVVFALTELDPASTDKVVILADKVDGKPLSSSEGPLRVIVPDEKRQARWVRQVSALTIMQAKPDASKKQ